jgi:membrane associated rhomboid family serine protease
MSEPPTRPYRIDPQRDILTPERIRQLEETRRFFMRLRRKPVVSYVLLAIMVIFWVMTLVIAAIREPVDIFDWFGSLILGARAHQDALVDLGAKVNFLVDQGQHWRLVAPIFLHFGLLHMLFNGYALYLLGRLIENLYGRRRFLVIFFFSGIASIVASYYGSANISVGASGALFGLLGAGTVVGYKHRDEIPPIFRRFFGRGLIPWILLNLALGFVITGIDNYAHIGGLIAGALVSLSLKARIDPDKPEPKLNRAVLSVLAVGIVAVFGLCIGIMLNNLFNPRPLDLPREWRQVSDERLGVSFNVPGPMIPVDVDRKTGAMQYGEPNFGFWVVIERLPETSAPVADVSKELLREAQREPGFKAISETQASLAGYAARRVRLSLIPENAKRRYDLDIAFAPMPGGILKVSCSAPSVHYGLFVRWCDAVVESVDLLKAGNR